MKTLIAGKYSRADPVAVSGFDMKQTRIPTAAVFVLFLLAVSVDARTEPGTDARGSAQDPAVETEAQPEFDPDRHERPIIEENGRLLLWASEDAEGNVEWFDMTGSTIDPHRFQFGIGKDSIPSIDDPEFVAPDDPKLRSRGITLETAVLGVFLNGIARAYPVKVMDEHEIVNDDFDGEAFAVLW